MGINSERLTVDNSFKILDLKFEKDFYAYRHLQNSFNKFVSETVPNFLTNGNHVFSMVTTENELIKHKFEFENVRVDVPKMKNIADIMFPADARANMLSYQNNVYADVTQVREVTLLSGMGGGKPPVKKKIGSTQEKFLVMTIPTMIRSRYCNLNAHPDIKTDECRYDPGGYFIVNGSEKVIIPQDRMVHNRPMVVLKKGTGVSLNMIQVNSIADEITGLVQTLTIRIKKDGEMVLKFSVLQDINPIILLRALGIDSDGEIIDICIHNFEDREALDLLKVSLARCHDDNDEQKREIVTQEDAIDYLITKMRVVKKYTETDREIKHEQKRMHLLELLRTALLPHIRYEQKEVFKSKALYIGYLIHRLILVELGREEIDDRDSYCNKRVANIDDLLREIMIPQYKSVMSECSGKFNDWMKDKNALDDPHNIVQQFKAAVFEHGFKSALMQGNWPRAKGVSQMMTRVSYLQHISLLSRIDSQSSSKSSSKLTKPRMTHPSSVPFLCPVQTPEHAKVGLVKHLSLIGSITIEDRDNTEIVREFVASHENVRPITREEMRNIGSMYKVFVNGDLVGVIENKNDDAYKVYQDTKERKRSGIFNSEMTSIAWDIKKMEMHFNTDSGRLYRPVLRVGKDNELVVSQDAIDNITTSDTKKKITTWEEFCKIEELPIEFIDTEEQPYAMIAPTASVLDIEREKIIRKTKKFDGDESKILNRYSDGCFVRYDYCEIHPSVLLGEIATNVPSINHNQGPRNIFQYAQGRQGMGIYNTVYRKRKDTSYILYHPETPLVNTRTSKYTYNDVLGPGSNVIVAIATYGGYNQEDSLTFNRTSLERGLFYSMSLRKYTTQITKNKETSANDKFLKPTAENTVGMQNGNYEKLNVDGYVPEGTVVSKGDILFGKVTPISSDTNSGKIYKDESEMYKLNSDGVVDRVSIGVSNQEGYETRKALVRVERFPMIGDKFCSRHGQKGTIGIEYKVTDMPYTKNGIRPDIIMNPNAIPSRMTIGQFWEQITAKVGGLLGVHMDATAFERYNIDDVKKILVDNGYSDTGEEYLYNGMTGQKIKASIFIGPAFYQKLKHMVDDKIHCVDASTDILTTDGWINASKIRTAHKVACLSPEGEIIYENPSKVYCYEKYSGEMYHVQNDYLDMLVTGNHKMYVSDTGDAGTYELIEAKHISSEKYYKTDGVWEGGNVTTCKDVSPFTCEKRLAKEVWNLSKEACHDLLISITKSESETTKRIFVGSAELCGDIQRLCLHAGYSSVYTPGTGDGDHIVTISSQTAFAGVCEKEADVPQSVYCITVSSGVFYARRSGKCMWTGNSRARGGVTGLVRQAAEGRARDGGLRLGEMERDALIAHGLTKTLVDKMHFDIDAYKTHVCGTCGLFAKREKSRRGTNRPNAHDVYVCEYCNKYHDIHAIIIPYPCKLMIQELMGMKILSRIRIRKDDCAASPLANES